MKKIKIFIAATLAATMLIGTSMTAFAYGWVQETEYDKKYYTDADNTEYLSGGWYWLDDNGDGIEECYYFRDDGVLATNTTRPHMSGLRNDAYINIDGMWAIDKDPGRSVQRRVVGTTLADVAGTIDKSVEGKYYLYHTWRVYPEGNPWSVWAESQDKYYEPDGKHDQDIVVLSDEAVSMVNYYNENRSDRDRIFTKDYDGDYTNSVTINSLCTKITFPSAGVMITDLYDLFNDYHTYHEYHRY